MGFPPCILSEAVGIPLKLCCTIRKICLRIDLEWDVAQSKYNSASLNLQENVYRYKFSIQIGITVSIILTYFDNILDGTVKFFIQIIQLY